MPRICLGSETLRHSPPLSRIKLRANNGAIKITSRRGSGALGTLLVVTIRRTDRAQI